MTAAANRRSAASGPSAGASAGASALEVWPGPMEGVAILPFVEAVNALGLVPRWMTPFFRVSDHRPKMRKLREFLAPFAAGNVPVHAQIMGTEPELLGAVAADFLALGAASVNLNFGCPSKRVTGGDAGGGALRRPQLMRQILFSVRKAIGDQAVLSVKLRAGYASAKEMETLLPLLLEEGRVNQIFFHYRTVAEGYLPVPGREERFQRARELLPGLPLILNGDVSTVEEGETLCRRFAASGVMIARPWMRDPYLLRRFADPAAPGAEEGRERFFAALESAGIDRGAKLELARMLWGADSLRFRALLPQGR